MAYTKAARAAALPWNQRRERRAAASTSELDRPAACLNSRPKPRAVSTQFDRLSPNRSMIGARWSGIAPRLSAGTETGVRRVEGVGLHSDQRGAPDVPSSHPRSKPTIIAISALLELVEWLELRRKSRQGGCPCNAAPTPLSPPVSTRSESSASGSGGPPLVQSARAESPGRGPNPAPTPAPKTSRRRRAGGRS